MFTTRTRMLATVLGALAVGAMSVAGPAGADNGGRPFRLAMSGANEFGPTGVPINPHGDDDFGSIELRVNPGQEEVCWTVGEITMTAGDGLPFAAHIHLAPAGLAGSIVIGLFGSGTPHAAPTAYPTGTACVTAERELLLAILHDPAAYYVNLHNSPHGGGVMRAQLG